MTAGAGAARPAYRRIVLKLSGEALAGSQGYGIDPQVLDKIVEGKLEKWFGEQCLLEQMFIKDAGGKTKVKDLVDLTNSKTGERVMVKRFARFQIGGGG